MDQSHLDRKYFIDNKVYNCPFCNRNNLPFKITNFGEFNRSNDKKCYFFITKCSGCQKESLHLTYYDIISYYGSDSIFINLNKLGEAKKSDEIDYHIFHHQPTSFFTIDNRINKKIRDLISESEGCLKMSYLVGASACLRKAIYELISIEGVEEKRANGYVDYQRSIKNLKDKFNFVEPQLFDAMSSIQELISDNIHEKSWDKWDSNKIKDILSLLKEILYEMYVIPQQKIERFSNINLLRKNIEEDKKTS